jgi:hypothetical protein
MERGTEDVDATVAIVGGGERLEAYFGGRRKGDSAKAHAIIQLALRERVTRRRRRRNRRRYLLRGWVRVDEPLSMREIAVRVGCAVSYVHKVLSRLLR